MVLYDEITTYFRLCVSVGFWYIEEAKLYQKPAETHFTLSNHHFTGDLYIKYPVIQPNLL